MEILNLWITHIWWQQYTAEHEFNEWKTVENQGFEKAP